MKTIDILHHPIRLGVVIDLDLCAFLVNGTSKHNISVTQL